MPHLDPASMLGRVGADDFHVQRGDARACGHGLPGRARQRPGVHRVGDDEAADAHVVLRYGVADAIRLVVEPLDGLAQRHLDRVDAQVDTPGRARQLARNGRFSHSREPAQNHEHGVAADAWDPRGGAGTGQYLRFNCLTRSNFAVSATAMTAMTPACTGSLTTRSAASATLPAWFSEMTRNP